MDETTHCNGLSIIVGYLNGDQGLLNLIRFFFFLIYNVIWAS